MKNRFNKITSKEWLPFQKSWFRYTSDNQLYTDNIRFFTKAESADSVILYTGHDAELAQNVCANENLKFSSFDDVMDKPVQFAIIDLRNKITEDTSQNEYENIRQKVVSQIQSIYNNLEERRFISIFINNLQVKNRYFVYAWDLAKHVSTILSIKDEKIGCYTITKDKKDNKYFYPDQDIFYCLYFRKDEVSSGKYIAPEINYFKNCQQVKGHVKFEQSIPHWFILKPQPRKKNEILHPAKYPEKLVEMFVEQFTNEMDNVFDPMSGTGSTQIGALKLHRNGFGTELSEFFAELANKRCAEFLSPSQMPMFHEQNNQTFRILNKDARSIDRTDFPLIDYLLTSPPYWDMLNMKGAENQAKRIEKGLQTNYSNSEKDLGNINDYTKFVKELVDVYFKIVDLMKPGAYLTIVVKNIKKKGQNYPFAWDLSQALQERLILLPEVFWCQDDISIAPYGFGNTWVSNTFHQYCLNFQKPL